MYRHSNPSSQSPSPSTPTPTSGSVSSSSIASVRSRHWHIFEHLYDHRLAIYEFIAILLAIAIGLFVRFFNEGPISSSHASILGLPAEMYFRSLDCLSLPMMCAGIVTAMSRLHLWRLGYIGLRIMGYCTITTVLAASEAALICLIVRPGLHVSEFDNTTEDTAAKMFISDSIIDAIKNTIPSNIVEAAIMTEATVLEETYDKNGTLLPMAEWKTNQEMIQRPNIKGILCFFTYLGICLGSLDQSFLLVQEMFDSITEATIQCIRVIIWFSPIAFFSKILTVILEVESFLPLLDHWVFLLTCFGILVFHLGIVVPVVYLISSRRSPVKAYLYQAESMMNAFVTSSSFSTFPITFHCLDTKLHTPRVISLYFLPISNTFNMDGSCIFATSATLYMAQSLALPYLDPSKSVLLVLSSALLSALITGSISDVMTIPFMIFGIPTKYISTLKELDWLLRRGLTTVNIATDVIGATLIHHLSEHILEGEI